MRETLTLEQLKKISEEKTRRLQNIRFKATVKYLLPQTKFYKELFKEYKTDPEKINSVDDWDLPLIKKALYKKRPRDFVVKPDKKEIFKEHWKYLVAEHELAGATELLFNPKEDIKEYYSPKMIVFSGGTESGKPTPVVLTEQQKMNNMMQILKIIGNVFLDKFNERTTGMNLFPYAPHLGWHAVHHALDINVDLNLCTAAGSAMSSERLVQMAGELKPNIICGMNSYLRNRWLPLAIEKKIKLPKKVVFVNGAQKMNKPEREKIKKLAGKLGVKQCTVLDMYGVSEFKEDLLPECKEGSGFHHIAPLSTIIRTIDVKEAGKELITDWNFTKKEGYSTIWNIDGAGTLLEGYLVGDKYDKMEFGKCEHCGLKTTKIWGVNRIRDVEAQLQLTGMIEEKVKGTRVNLSAIREQLLKIKEIKEAQMVVKKNTKDTLIIRYVTEKPKTAKKKIEEYFKTQEIQPSTIERVGLDELKGEMKLEGIVVQKK